MIIKFLRNMRIQSQLNQSRQEFTFLSRAERAYSVLMAAAFLLDVEKHEILQFQAKILRTPQSFTSEECYYLYHETEAIKVYAEKSLQKYNKQKEHLKQTWGMANTIDELNHTKLNYIAILFWLARLATNIHPKFNSEAKKTCKILVKDIKETDFAKHSPAMEYYNRLLTVKKSMGSLLTGNKALSNSNQLKSKALEILQYSKDRDIRYSNIKSSKG